MPISRYYLLLLSLLYAVASLGQGGAYAYSYIKNAATFQQIKTKGLNLPDSTTTKLRIKFDTLNAIAARRTPGKFCAPQQALCYAIFIPEADAAKARKDFDNGISFQQFSKRYPRAQIERNVLVFKRLSKNYKDTPEVRFENVYILSGSDNTLMTTEDTAVYHKNLVGKWVYNFGNYGPNALYFPSGFVSPELPPIYEKMISYGRIAMDSGSYFSRRAFKTTARVPSTRMVDTFLNFIARETNMPRYRDKYMPTYFPSADLIISFEERSSPAYENYLQNYKEWFHNRLNMVDGKLANHPTFKELLSKATAEVLSKRYTNEEMEDYIERYGNIKDVLRLKRSRLVYSTCGNDDFPRYHRYYIAQLAARANSARMFLDAFIHLMADPFEVSYNYPPDSKRRFPHSFGQWGYITELERLNVDANSLLLATFFNTNNPTGIKYYWGWGGTPYILGIHLAESRNTDSVAKLLSTIVTDKQLDDVNRLSVCQLFIEFNKNIKDADRQKRYRAMLLKSIATLPTYYSRKINVDRKS